MFYEEERRQISNYIREGGIYFFFDDAGIDSENFARRRCRGNRISPRNTWVSIPLFSLWKTDGTMRRGKNVRKCVVAYSRRHGFVERVQSFYRLAIYTSLKSESSKDGDYKNVLFDGVNVNNWAITRNITQSTRTKTRRIAPNINVKTRQLLLPVSFHAAL